MGSASARGSMDTSGSLEQSYEALLTDARFPAQAQVLIRYKLVSVY